MAGRGSIDGQLPSPSLQRNAVAAALDRVLQGSPLTVRLEAAIKKATLADGAGSSTTVGRQSLWVQQLNNRLRASLVHYEKAVERGNETKQQEKKETIKQIIEETLKRHEASNTPSTGGELRMSSTAQVYNNQGHVHKKEASTSAVPGNFNQKSLSSTPSGARRAGSAVGNNDVRLKDRREPPSGSSSSRSGLPMANFSAEDALQYSSYGSARIDPMIDQLQTLCSILEQDVMPADDEMRAIDELARLNCEGEADAMATNDKVITLAKEASADVSLSTSPTSDRDTAWASLVTQRAQIVDNLDKQLRAQNRRARRQAKLGESSSASDMFSPHTDKSSQSGNAERRQTRHLLRDVQKMLHKRTRELVPAREKTRAALEEFIRCARAENDLVSGMEPEIDKLLLESTDAIAACRADLMDETPARDAEGTAMALHKAKFQLSRLKAIQKMREEVARTTNLFKKSEARRINLAMEREDYKCELNKARLVNSSEIPRVQEALAKIDADYEACNAEVEKMQSLRRNEQLCQYFPELGESAPCGASRGLLARIPDKLIRTDVGVDSFETLKVLHKTPSTEVSVVQSREGNDRTRVVLKKQSIGREFVRECERIYRLENPFVVPLLGIVLAEESRSACLIMPYYERGNLRPWVEEHAGKSESANEIHERLREVFMAVAHLHGQNVVHADIKPENILVTDEGHVRLCDFGRSYDLSRRFESIVPGQVGTLPYNSPEIQSAEVGSISRTFAIDMWSLGIMMAELLSGELFSWNASRDAITNDKGEVLFNSSPCEGRGWDVVRMLLCKDPGRRVSAQEALLLPYFTRGDESNDGNNGGDASAVAYNNFHSSVRNMRRADLPSLTIVTNSDPRKMWHDISWKLLDMDLTRMLRVEVDAEMKPLAMVMHTVCDHVLSRDSGMVEYFDTESCLPAGGEAHKREWSAFGRLLAKCVMDGVGLSHCKLGNAFFDYLLRGDVSPDSQRCNSDLCQVNTQLGGHIRGVLKQRHGSGSTGLTTQHPWAGLGFADPQPLTDRNKRETVKQWCRAFLIDARRNHLEAARKAFRDAFDWGDHIRALVSHHTEPQLLFASDWHMTFEDIKSKLVLLDDDQKSSQDAFQWLCAFLQASDLPVLHRFVVRATSCFGPKGLESQILVAVSDDSPAVRFRPHSRLVILPLAHSNEQLGKILEWVFNAVSSTEVECVICADSYRTLDGIRCGQHDHFTCHACFENQVKSVCSKGIAALAHGGEDLVSCVACNQGFSEAQLIQHCSSEVSSLYKKKAEKVIRYKQKDEDQREYESKLKTVEEALLNMSADERMVAIHRRHIVDNILTLKCPRCKQAFVDFDGCYALTCHACGCGFCAICLQDCGRDAHTHVRTCAQRRAGVGGGADDINRQWRAMRKEKVQAYLETIEAVEIKQAVVQACDKDFENLGIRLE